MVLELSKLNLHEFGRSDKWDVRFRSGGPAEFSDWLPATDLSVPIFNISSYEWNTGHRMLSIPKALDYPEISMTLIDDDKRTIKKFLRTWCEEMFPGEDDGIQYLSKIAKILDVTPLTLQNEEVETESYIVYPSGSVMSVLNSSADAVKYPVSFKVIGKTLK